jgi:hypothetical protein
VVDCEVTKGALAEVTPKSTIPVFFGVNVVAGKARLAKFPNGTDEALAVVSVTGVAGTDDKVGVLVVPVIRRLVVEKERPRGPRLGVRKGSGGGDHCPSKAWAPLEYV